MKCIDKPILVYTGDDDSEYIDKLFETIREEIKAALGNRYIYGHDAQDVYDAAVEAEQWCSNHGLRVKDRTGMIVVDVRRKTRESKSYDYLPSVSMVKLVRKTKGWYLVGVGWDEKFPSYEGWSRYHLTPEQDKIVRDYLFYQYTVQITKAEVGE